MSKIEEIKDRLKKATEMPWVADGNQILQNKYDKEDYRQVICKTTKHMGYEYDVQFIANAPSDIAYLLEQNERYCKALEQIKQGGEGVTLGWAMKVAYEAMEVGCACRYGDSDFETH